MGLISQHAWLFFYSFARNFRRKSLGEILILCCICHFEWDFLNIAIGIEFECL